MAVKPKLDVVKIAEETIRDRLQFFENGKEV